MQDSRNSSRRDFLTEMAILPFIPQILFKKKSLRNIFDGEDFEKMKKIDLHTHISTDAAYLREIMNSLNMKMLTIVNEALKTDRLRAQMESAREICKNFPRYYAWCTTFGFDRMNLPDWKDRVIEGLNKDFIDGALAVKVWKEIGMELKDSQYRYVQIDNPVFDPMLEHIAKENKTLFAHIGDPVQNWLATGPDGRPNGWYKDDGGVNNRIGRFRGEVSYADIMLARDRMLARHPNLKVIGCHMGSMAFDTDLVAERLDRFPNFAVETSSAITDLMDQAREKVRAFFIKYQDRIMYASDMSGGTIATDYLIDMSKIGVHWTAGELEKEKADLLKRYQKDFDYYSTGSEIRRNGFTIRGLDLPEEVLMKIFYANAVQWVPGIEKDFR